DRVGRVVQRELEPLPLEVEAAVADAPGPWRHREASVVVVVDVWRHEKIEVVDAQGDDPAARLGRDLETSRPRFEREHARQSRACAGWVSPGARSPWRPPGRRPRTWSGSRSGRRSLRGR